MRKLNQTELNKRLEELAEKGIADKLYSGIAGRVLQNGEPVTEILKGVADLDTKQPVTADTMFRLASMTKPVTASAVLAAQDMGLLTVFDEVRKYLPAYGEMWVGRKVTHDDGSVEVVPAEKAKKQLRIHHLLSHVNGICSGELGNLQYDRMTNEDRSSLENIVNWMGKHLCLDFQPDEVTGYSGVAAQDVAARIVEIVSGMPFDEFVQKTIFDPIGVKDITFRPTDEQWSRMMCMFVNDGEHGPYMDRSLGRTTFECFPITYFSGGASLTGTLNAYTKFAEMLRQEGTYDGVRVLSPAAVKLMQAPWPLPGTAGIGPVETWGLGVRTIRDGHPWLTSGTFGWSGAYGTHFWIDPENKVTAIMMRNSRIDGGAGAAATLRFEQAVNGSFEG
ncbi:MAG: beta-lactamase family protein [Clostridia bacterium]|nr:beta-lactamase family protein [Clostridia bacterium]